MAQHETNNAVWRRFTLGAAFVTVLIITAGVILGQSPGGDGGSRSDSNTSAFSGVLKQPWPVPLTRDFKGKWIWQTVFDHLEAKLVAGNKPDKITIRVKNPTMYDTTLHCIFGL